MNETQLLEELGKLVQTSSSVPHRRVPPDPSYRLREDAGLESLGVIELIVSVEERFDILLDPLADDFADGFQTLGSLAALVNSVLARKSG